MAFSGNLKEMRGKEPLADWTNLLKPLGGSTGCFTHTHTYTTTAAAPAHTRRDLKRLKAAARLMFAKFCSTFSTQQTSYPGRQTAVPFPSQTPDDPVRSCRNTRPRFFLLLFVHAARRKCAHQTPCHQICRWHGPSFQSSSSDSRLWPTDWVHSVMQQQCLDHTITKTRQPTE